MESKLDIFFFPSVAVFSMLKTRSNICIDHWIKTKKGNTQWEVCRIKWVVATRRMTLSFADSYCQLVQDSRTKMLASQFTVVIFFVAFQSSVRASLVLHGQPLLTGVTEFTFEVTTSTLKKATPCYVTSGVVSQCRRKRGMEEEPRIQSEGLDIKPSEVTG